MNVTMLPLENLRKTLKSNPVLRLSEFLFAPNLRILVLAPHPDDFDEVAITLRHFFTNGNEILLLVLTGGAAGVLDDFVSPVTIENKVRIREKEQLQALQFFGFPTANVRFLRLSEASDGELLLNDSTAAPVTEIFNSYSPDIISLPYGKDTNTGHQRTYALFHQMAGTCKKSILAMYHKDPKTTEIELNAYVPFDAEQAKWKAEMLRFHQSQHTRNLKLRDYGLDDRILEVNKEIALALKTGSEYAEGFKLELLGPGE